MGGDAGLYIVLARPSLDSHCSFLFLFHGVDQGEELAAVDNFHEGLALSPVADHVNGGRVLEFDALAEVAVGAHLIGEFALGIDYESQIHLVLGGEFFRKGAEVVFIDFQLMGETLVTELIAQLLGMRVEVAGKDSGVEGPRVKR